MATRGRTSAFAGKHLRAAVGSNPRRPGSHGYRSLQIIIDNPGISTEDFVKSGGRLVDLAWDYQRDRVVVE